MTRAGGRAVLALWLACTGWTAGCFQTGSSEGQASPCGGGSCGGYVYRVPGATGDGWTTADLASVGVDTTAIEAMMDAIASGQIVGVDSVTLVKDGYLVLDEVVRTKLDRFDSTLVGNQRLDVHSLMSVTKSVLSALVGIALDQQKIPSIDVAMLDYVSTYDSSGIRWDPRKADITLRDLLTMQHGLVYDEATYPWLPTADWVQDFYQLPMAAAPGTAFDYCSLASMALGELVERAVGEPLDAFANTFLFEPIGISTQLWSRTPTGHLNTGWGLFLSGRDMAKFGQLYLGQGQWNGATIVSSAWVAQSTTTQVRPTVADPGYALHWWTDTFDCPSGPCPGFTASGNGGQEIVVIPNVHLVLAITAHEYGEGSPGTTECVDRVLSALR